MKLKKLVTIGLLAAMSLTQVACTTNQTKGNLIGGATGGYIGSQFGKGDGKTAMTVLGTMGGAYVGGAIGGNMDETERLRAEVQLLRQQQGRFNQYNSGYTNNSVTLGNMIVPAPYTGAHRRYQRADHVGFTTKANAGVFVDDDATTKWVSYNGQICVKEPFYQTVNGIKDVRVVKVRCETPDGHAYVR